MSKELSAQQAQRLSDTGPASHQHQGSVVFGLQPYVAVRAFDLQRAGGAQQLVEQNRFRQAWGGAVVQLQQRELFRWAGD
jgi:hypothetical protein